MLSLFYQLSFSQKEKIIDSLRTQLSKDSAHIYRYQKLRPVLRIDNRDSYIKNKFGEKTVPLYVNGIQFDLIYKEKHILGICGYTITTSSKVRQLKDFSGKIRYQDLDLAYATLYYQSVISSKRFFELSFPIEVGLGKYRYHLKDENKNLIIGHDEYDLMKMAGLGAKLVIKPVRWIGFSVWVGYKLILTNPNSDMEMSSPYTSFGLWVDPRQIARDSRYYLIKRSKYRKQVKELQLQG